MEMKIYSEKSLRNFEFWSGAVETANTLTFEQLDAVETILENLYPEGIDETTVNDIFWFEPETIADWLDFSDWEALEKYNNGEEEEEEEEEETETN